MFTTVAFCEDGTPAGVLVPMAGVSDQTHRVNGDDIYIGPRFNRIVGLYIHNNQVEDAYVSAPSMLKFARNYICPFHFDTATHDQSIVWDERIRNPIPLVPSEALNAFFNVAVITSPAEVLVGVWLGEGPISVIEGEVHTIRAHVDPLAIGIGEWVYSELTWTPDLPVGRYAVVGMRAYMQRPGIVRFVPVGEVARPGAVAMSEYWNNAPLEFRKGKMGTWFEFDSTTPPGIEAISDRAGSTCVYARIDLIKVA